MRDIKFRAWDESKKIMHFDVEFIRSGTEGNDWIIFKSDKQTLQDEKVLDNPYFQLQIKLMQYTGLKDKNGVEIYEGDIVKEPYYVDEHNGFLLLEVMFDKGAFLGKVINKKGFGLQVLTMYKEVIGNIYEHPHLLGEWDGKSTKRT